MRVRNFYNNHAHEHFGYNKSGCQKGRQQFLQ